MLFSIISLNQKFIRLLEYEAMSKSEIYNLKFDPHKYLQYYTEVSDVYKFPLKEIHGLFQSYKATPAGLKILDFGCGPIPAYQCSATPYASEIVFTEYTERNCEALQKWLDKDPNVFDLYHSSNTLFKI